MAEEDIQLVQHREGLEQVNAADDLMRRAQALRRQDSQGEEEGEEEGGFLADIGRGFTETPRAMLKGARDALQETADLADSMGMWLDQRIPLGGFQVGDDGLRYVSRREMLERGDYGDVTLPDVDDPESQSGKMVKSVAQFVTGFLGGGRMLKGVKAAGRTAKTAKAAVQGAIADFAAFDPHEDRLSDLIQNTPLANPVTEYLQADPTDSEAEGRFKNAIEGLGLGTLTDGFLLGVRTLRRARSAKSALQQVDKPEVAEGAFDVLGDPDAPVVRPGSRKVTSKAVADPADAELPGGPKGVLEPADPETYINFARINAPEDVQNVMQQMANSYRRSIQRAGRGVRPFRDIEMDSADLNAWDVLAGRREGTPLSAEESIAARNLWAATGKRLTAVAKEAAQNPSETNLFAFRKMMAIHRTVQQEVIAARTETARALASWRIPTGGSAEQFRQISDMLEASGGSDLTREMAQRFASAVDAGDRLQAEAFIEKGFGARTHDAVVEAWVNALLSGPKTHLVNALSNTGVILQQTYERATAARIGQFLGDESSVEVGEAVAQYSGLVSGLKDAISYSAKAFRTGESGFGLAKVELPRRRAISSEAFRMSSDTWAGRAVDWLGAGANVPVRALGAADEFFKTIGYRMELNAQAVRIASKEVSAGDIAPGDLKSRIVDIIENPPESVRMTAVDAATYQTFTNQPGTFARKLQDMTRHHPTLKFIAPFIRTPANLMTYAFERTPIAPVMRHVRADIAAGGARRDLQLARMATGTMSMMVAADYAMDGQITAKGPDDPAARQLLRRTGWQPYSVKVGDRYFAYNRMDPIGMTMGMAAEMTEILMNSDDPDTTTEEATIAGVLAISNNAMSKTYLSGISSLVEALSNPDMYGERWFQRMAGSVVPTGVAEVARFDDPIARQAYTMMDSIRRRTPGLSDNLPPRRDVWGREISYQSGLGALYDAASPIYSSIEKAEPIDKELFRLEATVSRPNKKTSFDGVTLNLERHPKAYSRYIELAGNGLKHPAWELGAKDFLNRVVNGRHELSEVYRIRSDGPDGGKAEYIQSTVNDYRRLARRQLLNEFPELRAEYDRKIRKRRELDLVADN